MKKLLFLLAISFCLTASAQKKVIDSKTTYAREVLQPYVDRGELPGAISVFYNNGVQETCCIGYANVEQKRPIRMDNVFMQCSQTKGFCGVTIAKLVEEGKLSLDDPVSRYLPEFKELWVLDSEKDGIKTLHKAKNVLTVRMVMNHTGGFPFEASVKRNDVRGGGWSGGAPLRQVAAVAAGSPIMFEPGTKDRYSNTGIDIGGAIVEVITGMKWEEVNVDPSMELEYENAHIYEIGADTLIDNVTYKKVLKDNEFSGIFVRESGDKVWLLTKEYPTEFLLYDFDWDGNKEIETEYLKNLNIEGNDYALRKETIPMDKCQDVTINGRTYQYYRDSFIRSQIRGIGKVAELNRYPCLLGYKEMAVISPGLIYIKVRWIQRNGKEIFRSDYAKEWTSEPPGGSKTEINMAYRPFVEDGKVWKVGNCDSGNPVQWVDYYYFDGDTIVDGKTCKQMMRQRYLSPDYLLFDYYSEPSLIYVGAWYEEDKKVYEYDTTSKQFKLMYDFSLEDNGTFQKNDLPYVYVVGPRKTGGIKGFKGVYRDVLEWADEKSYKCAPWMEGVGVVYGPPTQNVFNVELADPAWFLMECYVGDEVIYLIDGVEDGATPDGIARARGQRIDFTHTTKIKPKTREKSEEKQSLYGEYNKQRLSINLEPINDAYLVSITDESGKAVYEKPINAGNIIGLNIDISAYSEGRYIVTVDNSNESFTGEFNVLMTGIEEVKSQKSEVRGFIYNLQGRRLSSLQKGLNIVNGRKVLVTE